MKHFFRPLNTLSIPFGQRLRSPAIRVLAGVVGIEIAVVSYFYFSERIWLKANEKGSEVVKSYGMVHSWWPFESPGVINPPTVAAAQATLHDDAKVIGVEFQGKSRAYRVSALRDLNQHIVNDKISGHPLSVTFCDITDCCRVYTGDSGAKTLPIHLAGILNGEMVVEIEGVQYRQASGEAVSPDAAPSKIPFSSYAFQRTTWGEWKRLHPETDVFLGVETAAPKETKGNAASAEK